MAVGVGSLEFLADPLEGRLGRRVVAFEEIHVSEDRSTRRRRGRLMPELFVAAPRRLDERAAGLEVSLLGEQPAQKDVDIGASVQSLAARQERLAACDRRGNRGRSVVERVAELACGGRSGPRRPGVVHERTFRCVFALLVTTETATLNPACEEPCPAEPTIVPGCFENRNRSRGGSE